MAQVFDKNSMPWFFARKDAGIVTNGAVDGAYLTTANSRGRGPLPFTVKGRIFYRKEDFLKWFEEDTNGKGRRIYARNTPFGRRVQGGPGRTALFGEPCEGAEDEGGRTGLLDDQPDVQSGRDEHEPEGDREDRPEEQDALRDLGHRVPDDDDPDEDGGEW